LITLATFTIRPLEAIAVPGEGEHLKVNLIAGPTSKQVVLPPDAWISTPKFLHRMPSKEFAWTGGSTADLQWLRQYLSGFEMKVRNGVRVAGFHDGVFVTEEGAVGPSGPVEGIVFLNEMPSRCSLVKQKAASQDQLKAIGDQIANFNTPEVSLPILGWTVACFFKERLHELLGHFPLLALEGEAGSGKTRTVECIVMAIWALEGEPKGIGEQTRFTFMKLIERATAGPHLEFDPRNLQRLRGSARPRRPIGPDL
jgi:hypothetical protein